MAKMKKVGKRGKRIAAPVIEESTAPTLYGEVFWCRVTLFALVILFTSLAFLFYFKVIPKQFFYSTLVLCAVGWFAIEYAVWKAEIERIKKALFVGLLLMLFDFVFENAGWLLGLWATHESIFAIGVVPIEIMLVCVFGGAAWALYLPRKFDRLHSAMDIIVIAVYGALGEHLLRLAGLMSYYGWWNIGCAMISYALTFALFNWVRYQIMKE